MQKLTLIITIFLSIGLSIGLAPKAQAAGGETTEPIVGSCQQGKIWDTKQKKCVPMTQKSQLDNDNLYQVAKDLAYQKRYGEVLELLDSAKNSQDPRLLNYLGYATRQLGEPKKSLIFYKQALEIDPDFHPAREYIGEAFLQLNMIEKAKAELNELKTRCGKCNEYEMLHAAITKFENS